MPDWLDLALPWIFLVIVLPGIYLAYERWRD